MEMNHDPEGLNYLHVLLVRMIIPINLELNQTTASRSAALILQYLLSHHN